MSRLNSLKQSVFTVVVLAMVAGCAPLKIPKPNVWPFTSEDSPGTPTRIVASWTDTVLYQANQVPMRGFGGRLLFYSGEKPEPIKVDGTLTVYVFDETNRDPNNAKPDRKYVFTKDQLSSHYSKSKLGNSYSVWLPWDETGGPQKDVSMIARFTPEKGGVVVGEQTKQILPGKMQIVTKKPGDGLPAAFQAQALPGQLPSPQISPVQAASYVTPLPPVAPQNQGGAQNTQCQPRGVDTTTIQLPPKSILRNSLARGDMPCPNSANPDVSPIPVNPNYVTKTGVINPVLRSTGEIQPAGNQPPTAGNQPPTAGIAGTTCPDTVYRPWNQVARPFSPPNRFAPGQPQVPNAPTSQPIRDPGPWPQSPSTPQSFPDTTPQSTTTANGYPQSSLKAGLIQN